MALKNLNVMIVRKGDFDVTTDPLTPMLESAGSKANTVGGLIYGWGAGTDANVKEFEARLAITGAYPQLLFFTTVDGTDIFLAKLVQGQINYDNVVLMTKALQRLVPNSDGVFYDPEFALSVVGFANIYKAPGGALIGFNPWTDEAELDGGQYQLDKLTDLAKTGIFLFATYYGLKELEKYS